MNARTKIFLIILLGLLPIVTIGQKIEYYDFSISTAYLPSCGCQSERYLKENNKIKRIASSVNWKHCKRLKRKNLPKDKNIENAIILLDSLNRLDEFTFKINPTIIDSLKSRHLWKIIYKITDEDIDNFFNKRDNVTVKLKNIKLENLEGTVIDGAPYWFDLKILRQGQDTLNFSFEGNFMDGVQISNIKNWLPMYLAYREYPFFDSIKLVEEYFNDKKLESILFSTTNRLKK